MNSNLSEEYQTLLKAISQVAIVAYTDLQGRITYANENFSKISGYALEELYNQDHRLLNSGLHDKFFFADLYKTIMAKKVWRGEIRNKCKDGTYYWVDTQIIPILNKEGEIQNFASIRFDITQRKIMEESLMYMEKLASLGEMSAVVAHEINNPLAIIDLCTDSLSKELTKDVVDLKRIEMKIDKIICSSKRISKLVRGLKTISRSSNNEEFVLVELRSFVEEILSFSRPKCINEGIVFEVGEIPKIDFECRPDQISQVLINLINNAHDAASANAEKWIRFSVELNSSSNFLIFSITDSGRGIPGSIADKMLTPFFTTKEIGKGTGLGLSISKAIIEEHFGELYLEKKNKNTQFSFKIPIRHAQALKAA